MLILEIMRILITKIMFKKLETTLRVLMLWNLLMI